MKRLILSVLFISSVCFGSGKLTFEPNYWIGVGKITPTIGLSIYEKVAGPVYVNLWNGMGWQPKELNDSTYWFSSNAMFETWLGRMGIGVGYRFRMWAPAEETGEDGTSHAVYAKLTYKLW